MTEKPKETIVKTVITGIDIPFSSVVALIFQWAIAAVPAMILVAGFWFGVAFLGMIILTMFGSSS